MSKRDSSNKRSQRAAGARSRKVTAAGRLDVVLKCLTFESMERGEVDFEGVRRNLAAFINSFDGSPECGYIETVTNRPVDEYSAETAPTVDQLDDFLTSLRWMLLQGFGGREQQDGSWGLNGLRVSVRSVPRKELEYRVTAKGRKEVIGGLTAKRAYYGPGRYVLRVEGPETDLGLFLAGHLLTQPGIVTVSQCQRRGCENFFSTAVGEAGRPRRFCSEVCRMRNHADKLEEKERLSSSSKKGKGR